MVNMLSKEAYKCSSILIKLIIQAMNINSNIITAINLSYCIWSHSYWYYYYQLLLYLKWWIV